MGTGYLRRLAGVMALLGCMQTPLSVAETADERLQRLEQEIEELRQMLSDERNRGPAADAPAVVTPATAVDAEPLRSGVHIRYYIGNEPLGDKPPSGVTPTVEGRFFESDMLSFDPAAYDVPGSGPFSQYRDPASYRYIGLLLEGDLAVRDTGDYEFIVYPKPVREGGSTVTTRMSVQLLVDDTTVVEFSDQTNWQNRRGRVHLQPGLHRVQVWAMAVSDGFGPTPADSRLQLAFKGPGDASPRPLDGLHPPQE
ncbi:MAG: hypothetical protein J5I92_01045 [Thiogranum sp.]|nr:hypothetical protein [Thiogranum sp.]